MDDTVSALQHEIKQTIPFHSRHQEAILGLLRTADRLRRGAAHTIEPHGLSVEQYNVLRILRGAGPSGLPTLEVAGRMVEHSPAITRLIDKLEEKQFVKRTRCGQDRRKVWCAITLPGLNLLAQMDEPVRQAGDSALSVLEPPELDELIRLLDKIRSQAEPPTLTPTKEDPL